MKLVSPGSMASAGSFCILTAQSAELPGAVLEHLASVVSAVAPSCRVYAGTVTLESPDAAAATGFADATAATADVTTTSAAPAISKRFIGPPGLDECPQM